MHGFLNIDKPAGPTSHDVVARVRRLARQRRVGHAGTLDPAATGVLVVALGNATRLIEYVQEQTSKRYRALVRLGVTTTTDDAEGEVVHEAPVPQLGLAEIDAHLAAFRGEIDQAPPQYSAIHHAGRRMHELARAGIRVDLPTRTVTIERLALLGWEAPLLTLDITCSKGTYIRSLARDIGAAIGCGAHLQALRRLSVGAFVVGDAVTLEQLEASANEPDGLARWLLPPDTAVIDWPRVDLDAQQARRVRDGRSIALATGDAERMRAYGPESVFLALLSRTGELWKPDKVFEWNE